MKTEDIINKYPKIFEDYQGNPNGINWHGVPEGWLPIIDTLCGCMQSYIDYHNKHTKDGVVKPTQVKCTQMKEKFGGLRFYANNHDEIIEGMIEMAEYMCDNTCQNCGSQEDLGVTSNWISVLCRTCVIANGDRAMNAWKPKSK